MRGWDCSASARLVGGAQERGVWIGVSEQVVLSEWGAVTMMRKDLPASCHCVPCSFSLWPA
jgi:hypothetical protein